MQPPEPARLTSERLDALVSEAATAYADIKRVAEAEVVRSEWASGPRYALEPAYFEVEKIRRGQRLAQRPANPERARQYGFDAEGRVVVERQPVRLGEQWLSYETFFRHEAGGVARFYFGHAPKKPWLACSWLERGRLGVDRVHTATPNGRRSLDVYHYDENDRVDTVELWRMVPGADDYVEHRDLTYDEAGIVERVVWRAASGETHVDYEVPAEEHRLAAAQPRLVAGLADAIVAALEAARADDPVVAIAFSTSGAHDQHRFPPVVSVASLPLLQRVRDGLGADRRASLWDPAEWDTELALTLEPDLAALCASVSQDVWQHDLQARADHALLRLAAAIEARTLPLSRSEPFVVVVIEIDGEEAAATQVAGQVGAEARTGLRGLGLL